MRLIVCLILTAAFSSCFAIDVEAVTLASQPGEVFVPVREAANALGWATEYDSAVELIKLRGLTLDPQRPQLSDGTWLVSVSELTKLGARASGARVSSDGHYFDLKIGPKRVSVDLKKQRLTAWQGTREIYNVPVSTGREGKETPNGTFKVLDKERMHLSKLYGSPMPFSVHLIGNIYIHGSPFFSSAPGSHGCIRLQLIARRNVAEEFYDWVDVGTQVQVTGAYRFLKQASGL